MKFEEYSCFLDNDFLYGTIAKLDNTLSKYIV